MTSSNVWEKLVEIWLWSSDVGESGRLDSRVLGSGK